jgi:uncharacterized protein GlcG (DUF336 family)
MENLRPIVSSLTLEQADAVAANVIAIGRSEGLLPLTVAVCDSGGMVVSLQRDDGCGWMRAEIAQGKARGALGMGMASRTIRDRMANRPAFQSALAAAASGEFIPVPGGVLILDPAGNAIGAVGVSGDASDKDEYCAIAAVQAAGLTSDPAEAAANWRDAGL